MLELEYFPEQHRQSIDDICTDIAKLFAFPEVPVPSHRHRLIQIVRRRIHRVTKALTNLQEKIDLNQQREEINLVADWYVQTVGSIYVNYMSGFHDSFLELGGLGVVPLHMLNEACVLDHSWIREILLESFNQSGEMTLETPMQEALLRLAAQHYISEAPYELMFVLQTLLRADASQEPQKRSPSVVVNMQTFREDRHEMQFIAAAGDVSLQLINAFCYLRVKGFL